MRNLRLEFNHDSDTAQPDSGYDGWKLISFGRKHNNFENPDTHYKNGVDWHLDWGASQFLSERVHAGLVGYWFQQISGDSGAGARLGSFESRVGGIGPQAGYFFPVSGMQGYANVKGYWEFAAQNRPEGWNIWLTFALSPGSK